MALWVPSQVASLLKRVVSQPQTCMSVLGGCDPKLGTTTLEYRHALASTEVPFQRPHGYLKPGHLFKDWGTSVVCVIFPYNFNSHPSIHGYQIGGYRDMPVIGLQLTRKDTSGFQPNPTWVASTHVSFSFSVDQHVQTELQSEKPSTIIMLLPNSSTKELRVICNGPSFSLSAILNGRQKMTDPR